MSPCRTDSVAGQVAETKVAAKPFRAHYQQGPQLSGRSHMCATACAAIQATDADNPDRAVARGRLAKSGRGSGFLITDGDGDCVVRSRVGPGFELSELGV